MKRVSIFIILIAAMCISYTLCGASFPASGDTLIVKETPKRAFFITPFYQFTSFQDLRLIANTNNYLLWQGQSLYKYAAGEIKEYNDHFGSAYHSSISCIPQPNDGNLWNSSNHLIIKK